MLALLYPERIDPNNKKAPSTAGFKIRSQCASLVAGQDVLEVPIEELLEIRRVAGATVPGASRLVRVPDNDAAYRLAGSRLRSRR